MRGDSPIAIECVRPVSSGALVWRRGGRLSLTVLVKATLTLVNDGVARLTAPAELTRADSAGGRQSSLGLGSTPGGVAETDWVPYKPRVDVTYTGFAWAPRPVQGLTARMAVLGDDGSVERAIQIVGDRLSANAQPAPFVRMPIVHERAWAGPANENPMGVTDASGRIANLFDPSGSKRPVGFGPIPRSFPARQRLLGEVDVRALDAPAPAREGQGVWAVDVPATLPFEYFLTSPVDQRLDHFSGNETVVLENLIEGQSRLHTRLPGVKALARVFGATLAPGGQAIDLVADTVAIDGPEKTVSITWRGTIPIAGTESLLRSLHVMTGIEYPGYPMQWPAHGLGATMEMAATRPKVPSPLADELTPILDGFGSLADADDEPSGSTKAISPEEAMRLLAGAKKALPFGGASEAVSPPLEPPPGRVERTLSPDEALLLAHRFAAIAPTAPPPRQSPPPPAPPPPAPPPIAPPPPVLASPGRLPIQGPPPPPAIIFPSAGARARVEPPQASSSAGRTPGPPDVVVRVPDLRGASMLDEDSSIGSTMALTPEAAAALIARRMAPAPAPDADVEDTGVDSSMGSTMAFSPEAAAELIARRMGQTGGTAPAPPPPRAPPPEPPPPPMGPTLTRTNTVVMDAPSDVDEPNARKSR